MNSQRRWFERPLPAALIALGGLLAWVYLPTLEQFLTTWSSDPQYSHGYLVPLFSAYLLWARRSRAGISSWQTSWWGVAWIAAACLIRMAGAYFSSDWLDAVSLLPCLAGLAVLLGGWPALAWSWPAILFLVFMIPLPFRVAHGLSGPLQTLATQASGWTLQTLGLPALVEGNTILLDGQQIAIAEACNGLAMLIVFVALAMAMAIVIRRPLLDRIVVLFSAVPVALLANVIRITATGILYAKAGRYWGDLVFHDLAGWLMMPLAIGILLLVLKVLDLLLVTPPARRVRPPIPGGLATGRPAGTPVASSTPASKNEPLAAPQGAFMSSPDHTSGRAAPQSAFMPRPSSK
jgi:exosortase